MTRRRYQSIRANYLLQPPGVGRRGRPGPDPEGERAIHRDADRRQHRSWRSRRLPTLVSTACTCTNTKTPVLCTSGSGMLRMRATSRVARLSSHGITLAAIEKLLGRVGVLIVICCDAKVIPPDTQIDYVRGNLNDARLMRRPSGLPDLLIKSTL